MFEALRELVFPTVCLGCSAPRIALCAACLPAADVRTFSTRGVTMRALGSYDGLLRRAIVAMKDGERAYLEAFAALITERLPPSGALVPLPTSRARRAARGFDQSIAIAERVARACDVPVFDILEKHGGPQQGRRRFDRLTGPTFALRRGGLPARVTLLDDVCTTGSTIAAAVAALTAAGIVVEATIVLAQTTETPPPARRSWRPEHQARSTPP